MRINKWMYRLAPMAAVVGALYSNSAAAGCSTEPYIGSMFVTAAGWLPITVTNN